MYVTDLQLDLYSISALSFKDLQHVLNSRSAVSVVFFTFVIDINICCIQINVIIH